VTPIVFHPLAEPELVESAKFYEDKAPGLGGDFIREVQRALAKIAVNPEAGSPPFGNDSPAIGQALSVCNFVPISSVRLTSNRGDAPAPTARLLENEAAAVKASHFVMPAERSPDRGGIPWNSAGVR